MTYTSFALFTVEIGGRAACFEYNYAFSLRANQLLDSVYHCSAMAIFAVARLDCIRRIDFCAALLSPHGYRRTRVPSLEADLENSVIAPNQSLHQSTSYDIYNLYLFPHWQWATRCGLILVRRNSRKRAN